MTNNWSIDKLQQTWQLATEMHDGQKYGGQKQGQKVEYLNHIGSVTFEILAAINQTENMNADLAISCAILHDVIEDTEFSYEMVAGRFGKQIADGVSALTKNESLPSKGDQMTDSLQRIKQQPKEVWAVKMADRICNLYAPPFYWNNDKKLKYIAEARIIHAELQEGSVYLSKRLLQKIEDYHQYLD